MIDTFTATHCGQTFEGEAGAKALEAHMREAHELVMRRPGGNTHDECRGFHEYLTTRIGTAPGWRNGEIEKPYPWTPPRRTAGGIERVAEKIAAGEYVWPVSYNFPAGVRWSTANIAAEIPA